MRAVVIDPQLAAFGHHIEFNKHVLRLLDGVCTEIIFLDVDGIVASSGEYGNVEFIDITDEFYSGGTGKSITSEEFKIAQHRETTYKSFWARIEALEPDFVLFTSDGYYRKFYKFIPQKRAFKILVIIHIIWSVLRTVEKDDEFKRALENSIDAILVLEPFFISALAKHPKIKIDWFPLRSYLSERQADLSNLRNKPSQFPRIGTVGVVNERRNNKFLIDALADVTDAEFDYVVVGELMPAVSEEVLSAAQRFRSQSKNNLECRFGYLEGAEFQSVISSLDFGLLAYDAERNLQASAAIYSYTELGVPLLVPDTELFRAYADYYPGLLLTYPALDSAGLGDAISMACSDIYRRQLEVRYDRAKRTFFEINDISHHRQYLSNYLQDLINPREAHMSCFTKGNEAFRRESFGEALNYYALSRAENVHFHHNLLNAAEVFRRLGDKYAVSRSYGQAVSRNDSLKSCGDLPLTEGGDFEIFVFPVFDCQIKLNDFLCRVYWHYYPIVEFISRIIIITDFQATKNFVVPPYLTETIYTLQQYFDSKIAFVRPHDIGGLDFTKVRLSLVWKYGSDEERKTPFPPQLGHLYRKPIWRVDDERERFATSFYLRSAASLLDAKELRGHSWRLFRDLAHEFHGKPAAVFGTGPSLSDAFKVSFDGVNTIVANSMVKNVELLDHLRPKMIVCADAIFHAGPSTYAEEFRQHLRFALSRYQCPLVVPERDIHIYRRYFADEPFKIISVPFESGETPNYRMLEDFCVTTTGNVLTLFSLQIALSLSSSVDIYGCDGRPKEENSYFWGHDKSAQFNDRMDDIKNAHPGFFNISYDDYYGEHCDTLEAWLAHAESLGKVARSRTFSYIDALVRRSV